MHSLVTGGAKGIGRAIVDVLLARGDTVYVFDCLPESHEYAQALRDAGAWYTSVDVSSAESVRAGFNAFASHQRSQGVESQILTLLVNNAGIVRDGLVLRMREEDWEAVMNVNAKGVFLMCKAGLPLLMHQKTSYIVNIGSVVGLTGNPGQANYAASKAAIVGLTKSIAQEYARKNVLANVIAPGFIETDMTDKLNDSVKNIILGKIPLGRFGNIYDIAYLVEFLSSGKADYLTGQVLGVNGGLY